MRSVRDEVKHFGRLFAQVADEQAVAISKVVSRETREATNSHLFRVSDAGSHLFSHFRTDSHLQPWRLDTNCITEGVREFHLQSAAPVVALWLGLPSATFPRSLSLRECVVSVLVLCEL